MMRSFLKRPPAHSTRTFGGYLPTDVAKAYKLPQLKALRAPVVGILELGGGYNAGDLVAAFQKMGLPVPTVTNLSILGANNAPGNDADGEVALDMQNVAGIASYMGSGQQTKLVMAWCPNTDQGFSAGVAALVKAGVDAISISWGGPENQNTGLFPSMEAEMNRAVVAGIPVFCASGDGDSGDGQRGNNADYPASSPNSVGCGGTNMVVTAAGLVESVWNDGHGDGTGGGYSTHFAAPIFQLSSLPSGHTFRGEPDVAGVGDPSTGWLTYLDGTWQLIGGTSAVAPMWAGIWAALRASGVPAQDPRPLLYANPGVLNDITVGNNVGYSATKGWDPCTGLGTPNGPKLVSLFAPVPVPTPVPVPVPDPVVPFPVNPPDPIPVSVLKQKIDEIFEALEAKTKLPLLRGLLICAQGLVDAYIDANAGSLSSDVEVLLHDALRSVTTSTEAKLVVTLVKGLMDQ